MSPFLYNGLIFAILNWFWNFPPPKDRLIICASGVIKEKAVSLIRAIEISKISVEVKPCFLQC